MELPAYLRGTAYAALVEAIRVHNESISAEKPPGRVSAPKLRQPFAEIDRAIPDLDSKDNSTGENGTLSQQWRDIFPADIITSSFSDDEGDQNTGQDGDGGEDDDDDDVDNGDGDGDGDDDDDDDADDDDHIANDNEIDDDDDVEASNDTDSADGRALLDAVQAEGEVVTIQRPVGSFAVVSPPINDHVMDDEDARPKLEPLPRNLGTELVGESGGWIENRRHERATLALSDVSIPPQCGIYYYEVKVGPSDMDARLFALGLSTRVPPASASSQSGGFSVPVGSGSDLGSESVVTQATRQMSSTTGHHAWLYHGSSGRISGPRGPRKRYGPALVANNVVGCGVNFARGTIFFTKDGSYLGEAFGMILPEMKNKALGIAVALTGNARVSVNYGGAPFVFDIERYVIEERKLVTRAIESPEYAPKGADVLEDVARHMVARGYSQSLEALVEYTGNAGSGNDNYIRGLEVGTATISARQFMRSLLFEGRIQDVAQLLDEQWPGLLESSETDLQFWLRCQDAVEVARNPERLSEAVQLAQRLAATYGSDPSPEHAQHLSRVYTMLGVYDPDSRPDTRSLYSVQALERLSERISNAVLAHVGFAAGEPLKTKLHKCDTMLTKLAARNGKAALVPFATFVSPSQ